MKRYITGIIAVVIAVGAFAFTMPKKALQSFDDVTFYYQSSDFSNQEVAKKENWSSTATPPTCVGSQNKACTLVVEEGQTILSGGTRILANDITVMPGAGGATLGYVPSPSTAGFVDKEDRP